MQKKKNRLENISYLQKAKDLLQFHVFYICSSVYILMENSLNPRR